MTQKKTNTCFVYPISEKNSSLHENIAKGLIVFAFWKNLFRLFINKLRTKNLSFSTTENSTRELNTLRVFSFFFFCFFLFGPSNK